MPNIQLRPTPVLFLRGERGPLTVNEFLGTVGIEIESYEYRSSIINPGEFNISDANPLGVSLEVDSYEYRNPQQLFDEALEDMDQVALVLDSYEYRQALISNTENIEEMDVVALEVESYYYEEVRVDIGPIDIEEMEQVALEIESYNYSS